MISLVKRNWAILAIIFDFRPCVFIMLFYVFMFICYIFKRHYSNIIITKTPFVSKTKSEEYVNKTIKEFFYQASYILKKNGLIVTLSPKTELLEKYSEEYKFKREKETEVRVGDINYKIHSFKRSL